MPFFLLSWSYGFFYKSSKTNSAASKAEVSNCSLPHSRRSMLIISYRSTLIYNRSTKASNIEDWLCSRKTEFLGRLWHLTDNNLFGNQTFKKLQFLSMHTNITGNKSLTEHTKSYSAATISLSKQKNSHSSHTGSIGINFTP